MKHIPHRSILYFFLFFSTFQVASAQSSFIVSAGNLSEFFDGDNGLVDNAGNYVVFGDHYQNNSPMLTVTKFSSSLSVVWSLTLSGTTTQMGRIIQTSDNNYVVVGGDYAGIVAKISSTGSLMWSHSFSTIGNFYDVTSDAAGNIYALGYYYNSKLVKFDATGNIIWEKQFTAGATLDLRTIRMLHDGTLGVCGFVDAYSSSEKYYAFLMKLDVQGNVIWDKTYRSSDSLARAYSFMEASDHGFYLVGADGSAVAINPCDVLILKTDSLGNYLGNKLIIGPYFDEGMDVVEAGDGEVMMIGMYKPTLTCGGNMFFAKFNTNLDTIFTRSYGNPMASGAFYQRLQLTTDGGYFTAGRGSLWSQMQMNASIHLLKVDANAMMTSCYYFPFAFQLGTLNFITSSGVYPSVYSAASVPLTASINSIDAVDGCTGMPLGEPEDPEAELSLNLFPDPATSFLTVEFPDRIKGPIELMDLNGKMVLSLMTNGSDHLTVDLQGIAPGVYLLKTICGNRTICKRFVISGDR
jgi:hypothetical protein